MKKTMVFAIAAMAMATGYSMPTWALVDTKGANDETVGSVPGYSAYICKADAAGSLFGGATAYDTVTSYLAQNYVDYGAGIDGMERMLPYGEGFDDGVYSFSKYFAEGSLSDSDNYIAIVAYLGEGGNRFRVFESSVSNGALYFDPDSSEPTGAAGAWTAAAIPEPTSGLLLLFGLAGLALKRRRA